VLIGAVNLADQRLDEVVRINHAAEVYELGALVYICQSHIKNRISVGDVYKVMKVSKQLENNFVFETCFKLALESITEFVSSEEGAELLGIKLFQLVVKHYLTNAPPPNPKLPTKIDDPLHSDFVKIYETMPGAHTHAHATRYTHHSLCLRFARVLMRCAASDFTFLVGNQSFKVHRAILSARSKVFLRFFNEQLKTKKDQVVFAEINPGYVFERKRLALLCNCVAFY
jgi:hypothetical protein